VASRKNAIALVAKMNEGDHLRSFIHSGMREIALDASPLLQEGSARKKEVWYKFLFIGKKPPFCCASHKPRAMRPVSEGKEKRC